MRRATFTAIRKQQPSGDLKVVRYTIGALLGTGMDATCRECLEGPDSIVRAVKILQQQNKTKMRNKFRREVSILKLLNHKHVVRLVTFAEDADHCYIVTTICNGGSLANILKGRCIAESEAAYFTRQILDGLSYIHANGVIHRDIKPANLLIHNGRIKIIDFGYATKHNPGQLQSGVCGTPNYMAPEILATGGYSFGVDVWALGITVYRMLFGRTPFRAGTVDSTYEMIRSATPIVYPMCVSVTAIDFLHRALERDPAIRWTASQLLEHPFVHSSTM